MSLIIWLPLNGNINNQGLSGATFNYVNNNGALSVNNSGKIGKCYERTASAKADTLRSSTTFTFGEDISMCCWAYVSGTIGDTANGLVTNHSHVDNTGVGITVKQVSASDYRISCNTGTGSNRTYCTYYGTTNIKNAWHHLCLTYSKSKKQLKLWVDGKAEYTLSNYINASKSDYIDIFNWSTTYYTSGEYRPTCKLNDVRVYDHCLSSKEVKEISKGLVCHYELKNITNENFILESNKVTGGSASTGITRSYDDEGYLKVVSTSGNGNWCNLSFNKDSNTNVGNKLKVGDSYTISVDIKVDEGTVLPTLFINGGNSYKQLKGNIILGKWVQCYYTSTWNTPGTDYGNISLHLGFSGAIGTYHFRNFKLEKGSKPTFWSPTPGDSLYNALGYGSGIEYDTSGFGNNLTFQGTIKSEPNSPRYDTAYNFNQTGYLKKDDLKLYLNQFTVSFWIKAPASITAQHFTFGAFDSWTGNGMGTWRDTGTTTYNCIMRSNAASSHSSFNQLPVSATEWTLYTYSYNGTQMMTYKNGDKVATTTYGSNGYCYMPNLYIGNSVYGTRTTENDQSMMSDFRLYTTALSDTDVKELYNTPISLTDTSSLLVQGEFKEV